MVSSSWSVELEPEVEEWIATLPPQAFATVQVRIDSLASRGNLLRMPHSRPLGDGLFELRLDLNRTALRITYFFAEGRRIVLLTVFRKQRKNEVVEVTRARRAMQICIEEGHTVGEGPVT